MSVGTARPAPRDPYTRAQWFALWVGLTLLVVGLIGFAVNSSFATGHHVQGNDLIVFEVNGWHNLLHIVSGLLLLSGFSRRGSAKGVVLLFGLAYGAVALYGLIDGDEVAGLIPVDPADNVLHVVLSVAALAAGITSRGRYDRALSLAPRLRAQAGPGWRSAA